MDELDIQDLLQGFSAIFLAKRPEKWGLMSLDHRLECAAFGGLAGVWPVTRFSYREAAN